MSKLVIYDPVQFRGEPHKASVTWARDGRMKKNMIVAMRLFTKTDPEKEIKGIGQDEVDGLLGQFTPPESL